MALDKDNYPHLFKKHWKTPFRDSPFNIRGKEKRVPDEENDRYFIEAKVEWDPVTEAHMAGQQQPDKSHLKIHHDPAVPLNSAEMTAALWGEFERDAETRRLTARDYSNYLTPFDHDYKPVFT